MDEYIKGQIQRRHLFIADLAEKMHAMGEWFSGQKILQIGMPIQFSLELLVQGKGSRNRCRVRVCAGTGMLWLCAFVERKSEHLPQVGSNVGLGSDGLRMFAANQREVIIVRKKLEGFDGSEKAFVAPKEARQRNVFLAGIESIPRQHLVSGMHRTERIDLLPGVVDNREIVDLCGPVEPLEHEAITVAEGQNRDMPHASQRTPERSCTEACHRVVMPSGISSQGKSPLGDLPSHADRVRTRHDAVVAVDGEDHLFRGANDAHGTLVAPPAMGTEEPRFELDEHAIVDRGRLRNALDFAVGALDERAWA